MISACCILTAVTTAMCSYRFSSYHLHFEDLHEWRGPPSNEQDTEFSSSIPVQSIVTSDTPLAVQDSKSVGVNVILKFRVS